MNEQKVECPNKQVMNSNDPRDGNVCDWAKEDCILCHGSGFIIRRVMNPHEDNCVTCGEKLCSGQMNISADEFLFVDPPEGIDFKTPDCLSECYEDDFG